MHLLCLKFCTWNHSNLQYIFFSFLNVDWPKEGHMKSSAGVTDIWFDSATRAWDEILEFLSFSCCIHNTVCIQMVFLFFCVHVITWKDWIEWFVYRWIISSGWLEHRSVNTSEGHTDWNKRIIRYLHIYSKDSKPLRFNWSSWRINWSIGKILITWNMCLMSRAISFIGLHHIYKGVSVRLQAQLLKAITSTLEAPALWNDVDLASHSSSFCKYWLQRL